MRESSDSKLTDILVSLAAGIFIGIVLFEIAPEGIKEIGFFSTIVWLIVGFVGWLLLKKLTNYFSKYSLAIVSALAFWFHSFLEGVVTALSFSVSQAVGLAVALGMILHLVPEFFGIVGLMKGEGVSLKKSVGVDLGGIAVLVISFLIIYFFIQGIRSESLVPLEVLSGGAFIYIGITSFSKREQDIMAIGGLLAGLLATFVWRIFS